MVYGRILYNNIKEYTPKWFKTVPYAQTTKPTFGIYELIQPAKLRSSPAGTVNRQLRTSGSSLAGTYSAALGCGRR